jgi:putative heme-binding domain-containing protein
MLESFARLFLIIAGWAITGGALCAAELNSVNTAKPQPPSEPRTATSTNRTSEAAPARPLVKEWKVNELVPIVNGGLKGGRNFERGKKLYGEATCALCHHFGPDGGGVGPDLTGVSGSFSVRDLLEAIIEPSKQISSLYATTLVRKKDGETLSGWIPEETDDTIGVMESMFGEGKLTIVKRRDIETMMPSATSLMPEGLLNTLKADEILDLAAFLLSGGDSTQKMFR